MNEKIYKLAEQAGFVFWEMSYDIDWRQANGEHFEKFAELIVQQCATVCRNEWVASSSAQRYGDQCADSIEHYFNIKETV